MDEKNNTPVVAEGLPKFVVRGTTDLPGHFFLTSVRSRNLIMLDGRGNIVWSKHEDIPADVAREDAPADAAHDDSQGVEGAKSGWWDFKKHMVDGKTYYSYHDHTGTYDDYGVRGFGPGERVILDENFDEVKRITFEQSKTVEKGHPVEGHDFLMFSLDHYILSGYIKDTVSNVPGYPDGSSVVFSYLQEVQDGTVVWEFRSTDYPELYEQTHEDAEENTRDYANQNTDAPDYVHFNSLQLDPDGNLICSFRHISSILCLDRSRNENQIKWTLSGKGDDFGLTEEQKCSCQHYAIMDGEFITLFDNGNRNKLTRICSYQLDIHEKKLLQFRERVVSGKFSSACGSVQHLYDEVFVIGWGHTDHDKVCMSVYDFNEDREMLSVEVEDPMDFTYRCVYYEK